MIILRAAKVLNAPYEAQANVVMAKNADLSAAEIDAVATDGAVSGINPEYVLVCKATDELSKSGTLRDETVRELHRRAIGSGVKVVGARSFSSYAPRLA
jgi:hypothetical protein